MNETETPGAAGTAPPPQEAPRKASSGRIIAMLALGGPVLAIGGCIMFLANLQMNSSDMGVVATIGGIGFVAGIIAFVVGVIWALIHWVDKRAAKYEASKGAK